MPLQVTIEREVERSFFAALPGAFIYPLKGVGSLVLIVATIIYAVLDLISGGIAIFAKLAFYGFLFLFMQNILHSTAADEKEALSFPSLDGIFGAAFQLLGTVLMAFGIPIGLLIAKFFTDAIPTSAILATTAFGCLYFPMAFLAVAMKDTVAAANPLVVIPAIAKVPFHYIVAATIFMSVFAIRQVGSVMSAVAGEVSFATRDMSVLFMTMGGQAIWKFVTVYLLTISMRVLGLFYNSNREKLGWF